MNDTHDVKSGEMFTITDNAIRFPCTYCSCIFYILYLRARNFWPNLQVSFAKLPKGNELFYYNCYVMLIPNHFSMLAYSRQSIVGGFCGCFYISIRSTLNPPPLSYTLDMKTEIFLLNVRFQFRKKCTIKEFDSTSFLLLLKNKIQF